MAFNHSPQIVKDGLVLYLDAGSPKSYGGSGTTWTDISRNGNNGTLVNGVGYSNGAMVFDGVNDVVNISNLNGIPDIGQSITAEVWFNRGAGDGTRQILFVGSNGSSFQIELRSNTLRMGKWGGGTLVNSNILPLQSTWYFCTITTDGLLNNIYLNGNLINADTAISQSGISTRIVIGSYLLNGGAEQFIGSVGSVKIYNRVLTQEEVLQNYNATKGRYGL